MRPDEFIISITFFLICVVASLLIAIFHSRLPGRTGQVLLILNVASLLTATALKMTDQNPHGNFSYLFLAAFCTGIVSSGIFIRKKSWSLMRIYSLVYLLLIPSFLASPSKVIGFIGTGSIDQYDPVRIRIADNYYLIEQIPITEVTSGNGMYKVVREMGMFHKTLKRDIRLYSEDFTVDVIRYQPDTVLEFVAVPATESSEPVMVSVMLTTQPGNAP